MSALMRSRLITKGVLSNALVKNQTYAPALTRCLTEEQRKKRDAYREKMQYPDDTPVYLRGGPVDYALFIFTTGLVLGGTGFALYRLYQRGSAS